MSTNTNEQQKYVVASIARRCRISLAAARLVLELAGIGQAVRQ